MKNGCVISLADEKTAAMVRAALLLEGISCEDGEVLVTDTMPNGASMYTGIVLLSRTHAQAAYGIPLTVLHPPICFDELIREVRKMLGNAGESAVHAWPDAVPDAAPENIPETVQVHDGCVSYRGKSVQLTEREFRLFDCMRKREGRIVTRRELIEEVWDGTDGGTNVTDVYISYLRRKLTPIFGRGALLTVRGQGYILHLPDKNGDH